MAAIASGNCLLRRFAAILRSQIVRIEGVDALLKVSHAFALIFWASAIVSRKSVSAAAVSPCFNRSSPRTLKDSGRKQSFSGFVFSASSIVASASQIAPSSACGLRRCNRSET